MEDSKGEITPSSIHHLCSLLLQQDLIHLIPHSDDELEYLFPANSESESDEELQTADEMRDFQWEWRGRIIVALLSRLIKLMPNNKDFTSQLLKLEDSAKRGHSLHCLAKTMSFVQHKLDRFLRVSSRTNRGLLIFIYFLQDLISEELVNFKPNVKGSVKDQISTLRKDMTLVIPYLLIPRCNTFVGKTIKGLANNVGKFLYSFFFTDHAQQRLSRILKEIEHAKAKMEKKCSTVPDVPWRIIPQIGWHWQGRIILVVLYHSHSTEWSPMNTEPVSLRDLESSAEGYGSRICLPNILLFAQTNLKQFFTIPNSMTARTTQVLASFIDFLLDIKNEVVMHHISDIIYPIKDPTEDLCKELKFLVTVCGKAQFHPTGLEQANSVLTDIETLANHVGSFFHFLFFIDETTASNINLRLSDLLEKFETVREKIKEQFIAASKLPYTTAPKLGLGLLLTNDSYLDDLENLMDMKSELMIDVKDQVKLLWGELMSSRSILKDLKQKQYIEVERFEPFLMHISNVAHEAECLINYFAEQEVPLWYFKFCLSLLIEKMKITMEKLEELNANAHILNQDEHSKKLPAQEQMQPTKSLAIDDVIVGHDEQAAQIAEQLVIGSNHQQVISILGMPGLGKTTLSKKLYHDRAIVSRFDRRIWCVVSQFYEKRSLLIDILSSLVSSNEKDKIFEKEDERMAEDIYKSLKGRRYLIVLDDIWDIKAWDELRRYFPDDSNGSRILITSRFRDVAVEASGDDNVLQLPFLTEEECWELLQRKVFGGNVCPLPLQEVGKKIAALCEGLPLAVVAIAAVLADCQEPTFWEEVSRNLSSHISEGPNKCMHILEVSYKHLPLHLKPCFLYVAAFRKASKIPVRKLTFLLIAEGIISQGEQEGVENIAVCYLMDLIGRSLILVGERRLNGEIKTCKVHDLFRDLCLGIAKKERFMIHLPKRFKEERFMSFVHQGNWFSIYQQQYRLCCQSASVPNYPIPVGLHIRSMLGCLFEELQSKFLRVLDIWNMKHLEKSKLAGIEMCVHLRYLAVPYWLNSMSSLENLEFLFVDDQDYVGIGISVLLNMGKLRVVTLHCIHLRNEHRSDAIDSICFQHLHSFSGFEICHKGDEEILKCFPHLHKLKCAIGCNITSVNLDFLFGLEQLLLESWEDVIGCSITYPENLKELHLISIGMKDEEISTIGRLPYLELLKLECCRIGNWKWETSDDEFQQLKFLKLDIDAEIEEWEVESSESFPILERLVLRDCNNIEIPSSFGSHPTIQMIELHRCSQSVEDSATRIQEEQEDMGNEVNLIISR